MKIANELFKIAKIISAGLRVNPKYMTLDVKIPGWSAYKDLGHVANGRQPKYIKVLNSVKAKAEAKEVMDEIESWLQMYGQNLYVLGNGKEWIPIWD